MSLTRAFSLVELVIVIVIIGILINTAIISQRTYVSSAQDMNVSSIKQAFQSSLEIYQFKFLNLAKQEQDFIETKQTESGVKTFTLKFQASSDWSFATLRDLTQQECQNYLEFFGNQEESSVESPQIWNISYDSSEDRCIYNSALTGQTFIYDNSTGLVQ